MYRLHEDPRKSAMMAPDPQLWTSTSKFLQNHIKGHQIRMASTMVRGYGYMLGLENFDFTIARNKAEEIWTTPLHKPYNECHNCLSDI